jgi:hypothetical protein
MAENNLYLFNNPKRLSLPDFNKQELYVDKMFVFPPFNITVDEWYSDFRTRFFDALENRKLFPVFRSSHGEFSFVLGKLEVPKGFKNKVRFFISRIYRILIFQSTFYSGTPGYGYETYKQWKLPKLRNSFAKQLKWISENGVLCMYFSDRDAYPISYQKSYLKWLNKNNIFLDQKNYGHIYFIYALFNGSDRQRIFSNKRLLVVSSDQKNRTGPLLKNLNKLGIKSIDFCKISRSNSMEDKVLIKSNDYDLCLVGAGVGAANLILQLKGLSCPVIDAGFILDLIAWPDYAAKRIYCVNDASWEQFFPDNKPEWGSKFNDKQVGIA